MLSKYFEVLFDFNNKVEIMKRAYKRNTLLASVLLMSSGAAFAESPVCGEAQDDSWMAPEALQEAIESQGYVVESMDVSEGNCYQVTGLNGNGEGVMAYFDPRTGGVVQENVVE